MKKAFTLIEVMVSVMIFFIVVSAIMNIIKNNKQLIDLSINRKEFALKASVAFLNPDYKNNEERIKNFKIDNEDIIKNLKKDVIKVEKKEIFSKEYNISTFKIKEIINQIKAYNKQHSTIIYSLDIK